MTKPEPNRPRTILHLDMDAFFAAVEALDRPELRGTPVVVGSPPDRRGVVATCSYEARAFGIHSAMPSRTAYKLCPHATFLPPRMDRYSEVSEHLMRILETFTPFVEPLSIDEAFLDVTGVMHIWHEPRPLAEAIKHRIRTEMGLTASVGVAHNKFLAKLASDLHKPDGLTLVPDSPAEIQALLAPLPVGRLWGIGKVADRELARYGIRTIGQLLTLPGQELKTIFGDAMADHVRQLARGEDDRPLLTEWDEKSISKEHTFDEDCRDAAILHQTLLELTERVGARLRRTGKLTRTAQIKLRFSDFTTITRQSTLPAPCNSDRELLRCAFRLYEHERIAQPIRLIGFGVSNLVAPKQAEEPQLLLFPEPDPPERARNRNLDRAVDKVRGRFGRHALKRGHRPE